VPVAADRRQFENLRAGLSLEFHDHTDDARLVAPGAQQANVGVIGGDLARQSVKDAVELDSLEVDHETIRILDQEMGVLQWRAVLDRHPGVVSRRPDAHRHDAGRTTGCRLRQRAHRQQQ